jgi:hypothetical protein
MAGYLYASIGFFWLCTILCTFFFCFIPFAYFYIGDNRHLINKPTASKQVKNEDEEEGIDNETVVIIVPEELNLSSITVAVSDLNNNNNNSKK